MSYVAGVHGRRRPGVHRVAGAARRRRRIRSAVRRGGAHAGLVDISTFNVVNAVLAGRARRRATGCWSTSQPTTRRSRSCAGRPDLLPEPRRRHGRQPRRSRAPDGDVLRGSAAGRRVRPRAALRRVGGRGIRRDVEQMRRSLKTAAGQVEIADIAPGRDADRSDRRGAAPCSMRCAARRPAGAERGGLDDPNQSFDAAVLQRDGASGSGSRSLRVS